MGKVLLILVTLFTVGRGYAMEWNAEKQMEQTEMLGWPGKWAMEIPKEGLVIVRDSELMTLARHPERQIDTSASLKKHKASLKELCEAAQKKGANRLALVYDNFFWTYRYDGPAESMQFQLDDPEYLEALGAISDYAAQYDLSLELSFLAPLLCGKPFVRETGEKGRWMHYRKGLRDPESGAFHVEFWRQEAWNIHLGVTELEPAGVRVFAFKEQPLAGTRYHAVPPESMVEITDCAEVRAFDGLQLHQGEQKARRVAVFGEGRTDVGDLNRVLVVQQYATPEMDYFSPKALPFLKALVDKYMEAGIRIRSLYSDEMTILGDSRYFGLYDSGEYALRYVSPWLEKAFAEKYGEQFADMAPYMLYFCVGQDDYAHDLSTELKMGHVWGRSGPDVHQTALFRARYYRLLQDRVTDLMTEARNHLEERLGHKVLTPGHPTWAESPTVDRYHAGLQNPFPYAYDYLPNFMASNTVHQAASACYDYFKWGDFYYGNGNDMAEIGYLDRNYWGFSLASSTGIINEVPYSYSAFWGMPEPFMEWRASLAAAFGTGLVPFIGAGPNGLVQNLEHRDVDVLMLYPMDLVAVDEQFGSWMTQYAYANHLPAEKVVELGEVRDGKLWIKGRSFSTLAAVFEPFPSPELLDTMEALAQGGGTAIWSGPPPMISWSGGEIIKKWEALFSARYQHSHQLGRMEPGRLLRFTNKLKDVRPFHIPTHFTVDRVYPVQPLENAEVAAQCLEYNVGVYRKNKQGGQTLFLGFRPRDDQSESTGEDLRGWFEILSALGAYSPSGVFPGIQDNPEVLSRTGDFLVCSFPNGALSFCPHLKTVKEDWPGNWDRGEADDPAYFADHPLPDRTLRLDGVKVNGHSVDYEGLLTMSFRVDEGGKLVAFSGRQCRGITVDGRRWDFGPNPHARLAWAPVAEERRVPGGAVMHILVSGPEPVTMAAEIFPEKFRLYKQGRAFGSRGEEVSWKREGQTVGFHLPGNPVTDFKSYGQWLFVVPE